MPMDLNFYSFTFNDLGSFLILLWRISWRAQYLLNLLRTSLIDPLIGCTKRISKKEIGLVPTLVN